MHSQTNIPVWYVYIDNNIISYHIILYHIISYHIVSYHIISWCIISYHIILYHIISYHSIYVYIYCMFFCTISMIQSPQKIWSPADQLAPQCSSEFRSIPCPRTLPGPSDLPCVFFMGFHGISWHLMSFWCWLPGWWLSWPTPLKKWWTQSQLGWCFHSQLNGKIKHVPKHTTSMWFNGHFMGFPWDLMVTSWDWYLSDKHWGMGNSCR